MQHSKPNNFHLRKKIFYTAEKVRIMAFFNKKCLENRIDFNKLSEKLSQNIEESPILDTTTEEFYIGLCELSKFFLIYNRTIKIGDCKIENYKKNGFNLKNFEYAQTLLVEKAINNFAKKTSNCEIKKINSIIDDCRVKNIKIKHIAQKTM